MTNFVVSVFLIFMNPLVSVIIPVYGVEKYIEKCARSVFEQTYLNIEIIFVDDCSPDKSVEIVKKILEEYPKLEDRTRFLSYDKNRGLAGARKFGLEHALGEYVLQIDSDDFIEIDMIQAMVSTAVVKNSDITICDFNYIVNNQHRHISVNPSLNPQVCLCQVLQGRVHGSVANKLIKKSLYTSNNIWPVEGLNMREDLSVMYRLLHFAKTISYISKPFYNYIIRRGSISYSKMNLIQQKNAEDLIREMNNFCLQEKINDEQILNSFSFFKAGIKADILLYGNQQYMDKALYKKLKFKNFTKHPQLALVQKTIGVLSLLKCPLLTKVFSVTIFALSFLKHKIRI